MNIEGEIVSIKYAHEYTESLDWGMHKNYEFTYYYFRKGIVKGWGYTERVSWEWDKRYVSIKKIN